MVIDMKLNGADTKQGFVVAGIAAELSIKTQDGSSGSVKLRASGSAEGNLTINPSTFDVSPDPVLVQIEDAEPSDSINDHTIEAVLEDNVISQFSFTVIQSPRIQFEGRFQCRLSTDPDGFAHPWGANSSFGMYAIEGPNPSDPLEPPLDRIIRFHNPVALRKHALPVGVFVSRIEGALSDGSIVKLEEGDAVIGQPVSLGPQCKFDARDGFFAAVGFEPISDFEFSIGTMYSGATDPALPRLDSRMPPPNNAPYADGFLRMDQVSPLAPSDFGYPDASWTERSSRIPSEKVSLLQAEVPASQSEQIIRDRRIQEHLTNRGGIEFSIRMVERYTGVIDRSISIIDANSPAMQALALLSGHRWYAEFFDFDTDVQCGTVWGTLG